MHDTIRKRERTLMALAAAAIALSAIASTMYFARIDLTSSRAFTLSEAARGLHDEIPESVRISYFVSKSLADRHPGPGAIEDLLRELEAANKGKVRVRVVDPTKDSSEADRFGLAAQQMQVVEKSEQRVALVYTGIVVEYLDRHESIPAILSTETLEYEIVKAVRSVVGDIHLVAGLLVGDEDKSVSADYQTLSSVLAGAGYEPREIRRGAAVEDDVSVLFVLGNAAMDRYDAAFVDAYIMRGGKAFFAVKGVNVDPNRGLAAAAVPDGGLLSTLSAYGFEVRRNLVLDQSNLTVPFQTQRQSGGLQIQYVRYPHWVAVDADFVDADSPLTARFAGLDLYWPSALELKPAPGASYTKLAWTTPKAWLQTSRFAAGPEDQGLYALERTETGGQYLLAASATGSFPSAFAAGDRPYRDGAPAAPAPAAVSPETRLVVVSSGDFLTDLMRMSDSGFNASFALSAADWLSSRDDLISIRSRATSDTRLNRIKDAGLRDFLVALTYAVCLGLVPLGIVVYALARSAGRNRLERESRAVSKGGAA
ncbi:MAG: GldG family protein [Spirochaetes bacterium]|nr:GldG family protein [Spirochaetota bacterium]MBU1080556.1 GldG family protein [Spirochaetota bacterium]